MSTAKRNTIRRTIRLPLSFGRRLPAITADVSRGGFLAELPQLFVPGSQLDGYFLVDDQEVPFAGTVTWAEAGNPQAQVYSRVGVRFRELPRALEKIFSELDGRKKRVRRAPRQ